MGNTGLIGKLAALGLEDKVPSELLFSWLAQTILARGPLAGLTLDEIAEKIERETGLEVDRIELRRSIKACPDCGISITNNDPPYCVISTQKRDETLQRLSEANERQEDTLRRWANGIVSAMGRPEIEPEWLVMDLPAFFVAVAIHHGVESTVLGYGERESARRFLDEVDERCWSSIPERVCGYLAFCRQVFPSFFVTATGERASFIASVVDRIFELCRLSLASDARRIVAGKFVGVTVFLDTNILFRLLGMHGPAACLDMRRIIELGQEAKVQHWVTVKTLDEFLSAARKAARSQNMRRISPHAVLSLNSNIDDRSFFEEYYRVSKGRVMSYSDFLASLSGLERALERFGVRVWSDRVSQIERDDEVRLLARRIMDRLQAAEEKKAPSMRKEIVFDTAFHDAVHLKLVEVLRPRGARGFTGAKFWFLTLHNLLSRFASERAGASMPPSAIHLDHWHQLLRSAVPRAESHDATLARNLRSPLFQVQGANYFSAMESIAGRLANYSNVDPEQAASLVIDSGFIAQVAFGMSGDSEFNDESVDLLIESKLAIQLQREREQRSQVSRRLEEKIGEVQGLRKLLSESQEEVERARQEAYGHQAGIEALRRDVNDALAKIENLNREMVQAKNWRSRFFRNFVVFVWVSVVVLFNVVIWWRFPSGITVGGVVVPVLKASAVSLVLLVPVLPVRWRNFLMSIAGLFGGVPEVKENRDSERGAPGEAAGSGGSTNGNGSK